MIEENLAIVLINESLGAEANQSLAAGAHRVGDKCPGGPTPQRPTQKQHLLEAHPNQHSSRAAHRGHPVACRCAERWSLWGLRGARRAGASGKSLPALSVCVTLSLTGQGWKSLGGTT